MIEVAAAVIQRPDGAYLLAQRPCGKVYAGYWEFPGGKVEAGEAAAAALTRELHEELGIDAQDAHPWLTRIFSYPHGTVRLRFFRVTRWKGTPHPREDQAIAWQQPGMATPEPMLPANAPVVASLALPAEYAITDAASLGAAAMLQKLERRLQGGLKLLQVREPTLLDRDLFTGQVIELARRYGCKVMVKAPFAGADGIHLTAAELMQIDRRPASVGLVAGSCHSRKELEHAMRLELDFAVLGPVKEKSGRQPLGWEGFGRIVQASSIPVYAIGGLSRTDLEAAWRAGAHGVAMIRGSWV